MNIIKGYKLKKYFVAVILIIAIFSLSIVQMKNQEGINTSTSNGVSNKKIGWGIKRNDNHEQPDVGNENKKVLEESNGICLGNKEKKYIYLTFDEGYEAGYTKQILETLKNNKITATFFITAHYVNSQPELVQQMIDEGHIIGNHIPNNSMYQKIKIDKI